MNDNRRLWCFDPFQKQVKYTVRVKVEVEKAADVNEHIMRFLERYTSSDSRLH